MVGKLYARGDELSVWAARMIEELQDITYELGLEITRIKERKR